MTTKTSSRAILTLTTAPTKAASSSKPAKQKPKSYATLQNDKYKNSASHYVSARQRWIDTLNSLPIAMQSSMNNHLKASLTRFKLNYPSVTKWSDVDLAEARSVKLSDIVIDTTMQRQLDMKWAIDIVAKFKPTLVVPIQVYVAPTDPVNPNAPPKYVAWDGQHTLIALSIIASMLDADMATIEVPVNIFKSSLKSLMRENFVVLNGPEGKNPLDPIDIWVQRVYGVRIDGAKNPIWVATEQRQSYIEQNDLFVTSAKFGDTDKIGAITNIQAFNDLDVSVTKNLARYLNKVIYAGNGGRAADGTEVELMAHYFHQCIRSGITVDDSYVDQLAATALLLYDGDINTNGKFWAQAKVAYDNWHDVAEPYSTSRFSKHKSHGFPFLIAQMNKSLGLRVPQNNSSSSFNPAPADLF